MRSLERIQNALEPMSVNHTEIIRVVMKKLNNVIDRNRQNVETALGGVGLLLILIAIYSGLRCLKLLMCARTPRVLSRKARPRDRRNEETL